MSAADLTSRCDSYLTYSTGAVLQMRPALGVAWECKVRISRVDVGILGCIGRGILQLVQATTLDNSHHTKQAHVYLFDGPASARSSRACALARELWIHMMHF
jgi:hypothetical protein